MNVTEGRDSDFKNAFPGIFNFTVGILPETRGWAPTVGEIPGFYGPICNAGPIRDAENMESLLSIGQEK